MKNLIHICILSGLAALAASCWTEDIPEAGAARHQVEALTATPGDEEVTLAWEIPDGWNPTDYIVFYTDEESQTVTLRTGGASRYVVDKLTNGISYNFNVQAVYGKLISNAVTVAGRPSTSRLPVTDLTVTDTGDGYVALAWSAPSTLVEKYTLSYYIEDMPGDIRTQEIGKEQTAYRCEGLTNDKTWFFLLAAEYAKGPAEADVVRAMPTKAIPYFISSETAAVDQPVTFEFNRTAYADASDVTWTFPDGAVLTGDKVLSGFKTTGNQTVMLSAKIDGSSREWKITVEIRPYVVNFMDWEQADGAKYESPTYTCPVLSPDAGTVYVNTGNKVSNLYAFDVRTGKNKWTFRPTDNGDMQAESKSMVAVNPVSGDIYYGTSAGGQFYAVKPDGTLHWKFSKCGSMNSAPPAVSADGTVVYIADAKGALYALDAETGTEQWSAPYAAGSCGYGLLVNGGEVVLAAKTAIHFVNAADGTKIEAVSVSIVNSIGFAVSPDRKKAYFAYATTLAAVDLDSHTLYARSAAGGDNYYQPIVAGDGTVFAGTKDGYVRFFSPDLQTMIHEEQPSSVKKNTFNFTRPLVDANNRFYIMASGNSTEDSLVLEYDTSGNKISDWSYTQNNCQNGCNLADGVLYTVNQGSGDGGNGLFSQISLLAVQTSLCALPGGYDFPLAKKGGNCYNHRRI